MRSRLSVLQFVRMLLFVGAVPCALADDAGVVKEFTSRVEQYVKLQRDAERKLQALPEKAPAEQIAAHQRELAKRIRAARATANRGDILFPLVEDYLRRMITAEVKGAGGATARQTLKDGNPQNEPTGEPLIISVNAAYPPKAPVSTIPPTMLLRLPPLPEEVNYRFVGRHLILHDTKADLIVDFIINVVP